jgi:hypothetical protein
VEGNTGAGKNDDGVERPDRETIIALRKERKEQKKKSKQGDNTPASRTHLA